MTDIRITQAIESELQFSDVLMFGGVDVSVDEGMVSLTGSVGSLAAKRQAEDIASLIDGVHSIANELEIESETLPADEVREAVQTALRQNEAIFPYEIDVTVQNGGQVTLMGTVDSIAERFLAERLVATVPGIRSIDNQIEIDTSKFYRGSEEIDADISGRLRWDARVDASNIDILVRDGGRVTLSGEVGSLAAKRQAIELSMIQGVHEVDATHLEVVGSGSGPQR